MDITAPSACLLLGSLPLLVLSEWKSRSHTGTAVFKMLSSLAFLSSPLLLSTEWSDYRRLITIGLGFSLLGDFFLIPSHSEFHGLHKPPSSKSQAKSAGNVSISFQLGIVAFAAAHIAYTVAFLQDSTETSWTTFAATFVGTLLAAKWFGVIYPPPRSSLKTNVLDLSIASDMKPLVSVYAVIIGAMFAAATSTSPSIVPTDWWHSRALGAAMFVVSDLFVAKNAFGRSSTPKSRGWIGIFVGYGLYFWAQMVIAGTVRA
ncbi:unnamed protein product [Penicillium egyptiacum]|uniref:YhhN domain-containing protein n=1 Tax=Penicillium egyptiacum TaxID=1303716 RepID=A0A9W4P0Y2_9EURO|nr:unnamed protein product [Penicillium egyptiacum]